jgi:hypothetical protein
MFQFAADQVAKPRPTWKVDVRQGKQDLGVAAETSRGMTQSSPLLPDVDGH